MAMKQESNLIYWMLQIFSSQLHILLILTGGNYVAKDLYEAGGVPVLLKALAEGGHLNIIRLTVTETFKENLENIVFPNDQKVLEILIIQLLKQEE